jgi:hypothetical protein
VYALVSTSAIDGLVSPRFFLAFSVIPFTFSIFPRLVSCTYQALTPMAGAISATNRYGPMAKRKARTAKSLAAVTLSVARWTWMPEHCRSERMVDLLALVRMRFESKFHFQ